MAEPDWEAFAEKAREASAKISVTIQEIAVELGFQTRVKEKVAEWSERFGEQLDRRVDVPVGPGFSNTIAILSRPSGPPMARLSQSNETTTRDPEVLEDYACALLAAAKELRKGKTDG